MIRVLTLALAFGLSALVCVGASFGAADDEPRITLARMHLPSDDEIARTRSGPRYLFIDGVRFVGDVDATFDDGTLAVGGRAIRYEPGDASPSARVGFGELSAIQSKSALQHARTVGLRDDEFYVTGLAADVPPAARSRASLFEQALRGPGPVVLLLSTNGSCVFRGDAALDAIDQIAETGAIPRLGSTRPGAAARTPLGPLLREIESVQARP